MILPSAEMMVSRWVAANAQLIAGIVHQALLGEA